jgi:hypothetical protein
VPIMADLWQIFLWQFLMTDLADLAELKFGRG